MAKSDISLEQLRQDWLDKDEKAISLRERANRACEESDEAWNTLQKARKQRRKVCPRCLGAGYIYEEEAADAN